MADGTGTYTTTQNISFTIAWQFTDGEQTNISYTVFNYDNGVKRQGINLIVTWENVQLSTSSLKYAEIYTKSPGKSIISSAKRIAL